MRFAILLVASLACVPAWTVPSVSAADKAIDWRVDYDAARKESNEKGLPLFVKCYSDGCYHCKRLDAGPMRDATMIDLLNERYIPLKVNGATSPKLVEALRIQYYPTIIIAAADGKIIAFIEGYQETKALTDHLQRALAVQTPDWMARDFQEATKAAAASDYAKAIPLLKSLLKDGKDRPVQTKAKSLLDEIEQQAGDRLARVTQLEDKGQYTAAMDLLAELMSRYPGTTAANDGAKRLTRLADRPELKAANQSRRAQDLVAQAREAFKAEKYRVALELCEILETTYKDSSEGKQGGELAKEIRSSPEKLALACEALNERLASMYNLLGETWLKKGEKEQAAAWFEKAVHAAPASVVARDAQTQLSKLSGKPSALPAKFQKTEK